MFFHPASGSSAGQSVQVRTDLHSRSIHNMAVGASLSLIYERPLNGNLRRCGERSCVVRIQFQ